VRKQSKFLRREVATIDPDFDDIPPVSLDKTGGIFADLTNVGPTIESVYAPRDRLRGNARLAARMDFFIETRKCNWSIGVRRNYLADNPDYNDHDLKRRR
jgi:hypothetical protein